MASRRAIVALLGGLCITCGFGVAADAAEADQSKTAGGVTVHLGAVPAEIVNGTTADSRTERPMHGSIPKVHTNIILSRPCSMRQVAPVYAVVAAQVSGLGLSGGKMKLEPMQISGTTTYGGFVDQPGLDLYTVKLTVERSAVSPTVLQFKYDHRR